ncbi:MAG TPA: DNA ligase D [Terracidiphilus sp.]|jgi:bifunctional non-homologous end joining protein LigD
MAQRTHLKSTKEAGRPLEKYQRMRDFSTTAEPRGAARVRAKANAHEELPFVVQKHAATRLHYDFRLGWDGVLKSWAVTKGPSYYPGDKRLAVQVEDHPWEYRDFEGTIPKGQYGGGTVMVWDQGTWTPLGEVDQGLRDGHLKFELHGKKLKGAWVLVRMHGRAERSSKENWLLIKEKDEFARDSSDEPIIEEKPNSAASHRTMDEIAARKGRVWSSKDGQARRSRGAAAGNGGGVGAAAKRESFREKIAAAAEREATRAKAAPESRRAKGRAAHNRFTGQRIPVERFPGFIAPQLALETGSAPTGDDWIHELKLDGYRIQIQITSGSTGAKHRKVRLLTRKGLDWTARMPDIAAASSRLRVKDAILDGEAVALDGKGVSNFADLQAAFQEGRQRYITYFAFDLLHLDGHNLRGLPLVERKEFLRDLLGKAEEKSPLRLSEDLKADGNEVFKKACALGAEGIVSKLGSAKYTSGRSSAWLKRKCRLEQEFVIGGFTLPSNGTVGVGALLLGYYEGGKLRYAGRTGTGFTQSTHRLLRSKVGRLARKESPFTDVPREMQRGAHWVKPELVAQVEFSTWTRDNLVRQAAFKGLREDKPAAEVVRESADVPNGKAASSKSQKRTRANRASHSLGGRKSAGMIKNSASPTKKSAIMVRNPATHNLAITHPDKVLDQESGMTKRQLAEYYETVAENMLPHITGRPLSIVRCPDGNSKPCFFQKHVGLGLPAGVKSIPVPSRKSGKTEDYLTVDSSEGLVGLAQMGVLEVHTWGSRNEALEHPDRIVFDLDPDVAIEWKTLAETAREFKRRLAKMGLASFLKSTGGKGLHVVVPIRPDHEWPAIKEFAHGLALDMEREKPELYVTKMTKSTRKNRIYLDYLRNDREATSIAPYSPRARSGVPVAMPLKWSELNSAKAPAFHVLDFAKWKSRLRHDPWDEMESVKQKLTAKILDSAEGRAARS